MQRQHKKLIVPRSNLFFDQEKNMKFLMLDELKAMPIWIPYRQTYSGKQPSRYGYAPSRWKEPGKLTNYGGAVARINEANGRLAGVGVVVPIGFTVLDLDKCDAGPNNPVVKLFSSYTELSPSGKGLHIIIKCAEAGPKFDCIIEGMSVEFKTPGNFVTVTEKPYLLNIRLIYWSWE